MIPKKKSRSSLNMILLSAAWFGLVTGLCEGTIFLFLQRAGRLMGVWVEIVWISTLFDILLFLVIGAALFALQLLFPKISLRILTVFTFIFLALLDWFGLILQGRIHLIAIFLISLGLASSFTRWFSKRIDRVIFFWQRSLPFLMSISLCAFIIIQGEVRLREWHQTVNLNQVGPGSPNILIIVVDALRADHLTSYGYYRKTSPNLNLIAQRGIVFENAFSAASYTLPSHASLLTGSYPYQHGVEWETFQALCDSPIPSLAEVMQANGYRTAAFSANVFWFTREECFGRGFMHFEDYFHSIPDAVFRTAYGRAFEKLVLQRIGFEDIPGRKRAPSTNQSILRWIQRDPDRPFFVFVNYMDVHDPYLPPQPFRGKFAQMGAPGGLLNWRVGRENPFLTPEQIQSEIDAYDGAIAYTDNQIGQLLKELQRIGLDQNLLLIVTADHGEAFSEHGLYLHGDSLYREEIQVPLIIQWLGRLPNGLRIDRPVTNASIPSTTVDLTIPGIKSPFPIRSLAALWETPTTQQSWPLPFSEIAQAPWKNETSPVRHGWIQSVLNGEWHLIESENLGVELYQVKTDPFEMNDLSNEPEFQGEILELRSYIKQSIFGYHSDSISGPSNRGN